jgi:DNA-directed RNA polymerase specialized sigma54-like protein
MREHLANEARVGWAARGLLKRRGLDARSLPEVMRILAEVRGFRIFDEGTTDVIRRMVGWVEKSPDIKQVFAPEQVLRETFLTVMKKHLEVEHVYEEPHRRLTLSKPLVMTPELQQAIRLLQRSHLEFVAEVQREIEQNSLLEQPAETVDWDLSEKAPGEALLEAADAALSTDEVAAKAPERAKEVHSDCGLSGECAHYTAPDVFIYTMGGSYAVVLNNNGLSKVRIADADREALRKGETKLNRLKGFTRDTLRSSMWLIRSIQARQATIYRVTKSILKFQRDFFEHGIDHLKPLTLREVAEDIGMHESTVRRVTTGKYVHTPQGIFELKHFFTR